MINFYLKTSNNQWRLKVQTVQLIICRFQEMFAHTFVFWLIKKLIASDRYWKNDRKFTILILVCWVYRSWSDSKRHGIRLFGCKFLTSDKLVDFSILWNMARFMWISSFVIKSSLKSYKVLSVNHQWIGKNVAHSLNHWKLSVKWVFLVTSKIWIWNCNLLLDEWAKLNL